MSDASFDPGEFDNIDISLRVYVAGSSEEMGRAEGWMNHLRERGITVTSSWPEVIRKVGAANPMNVSRKQRAVWALDDLREIDGSNVFWLLLPEGKPSIGAYAELGFAISIMLESLHEAHEGPGPLFKMICSGKETSIFTGLADYFDTDQAAFDALVKLKHSVENGDYGDYGDANEDGDEDDDYEDEDAELEAYLRKLQADTVALKDALEALQQMRLGAKIGTPTSPTPYELPPEIKHQIDQIFKLK